MIDDVFAVVHIDDAPLTIEARAVGAAVTARAAVVDVGDGPAAARVVLDTKVDQRMRRGTSDRHDSSPAAAAIRQALRALGIARRIEIGVCDRAVAGRKFDRLRHRKVSTGSTASLPATAIGLAGSRRSDPST